jgi:hypothetical protein
VKHIRELARAIRCVLRHRGEWQTYAGGDRTYCPVCDVSWTV